MLKVQQDRTPEEAALARADASYSVFRFADALGNPDVFNAKSLPKTNSLFRKVTYEEGAVVQAGKRGFKRPRPFVLEPRIEPIVKKPTNDSLSQRPRDVVARRRAACSPTCFRSTATRSWRGRTTTPSIASSRACTTRVMWKLESTRARRSLRSCSLHRPSRPDYAEARHELRTALKLPPLP